MTDRATLLVSTPIDEALAVLEQRADSEVQWGAPHTADTIRQCVLTVREAMTESREIGMGTAEMSAASGWSQNTLKDWAKRIESGEKVPHPWSRMVVYRTAGDHWMFRASTVPVKTPGQAA